jgi:aldose 1-epimerase
VDGSTSAGAGAPAGDEPRPFGVLEDGRSAVLHTLRAPGVTATVCDYGATLVAVEVPDRDGRPGGIVLGFDDVRGYETRTNNPFMGATVGRVANRIGGARFVLDGVEHVLHANEGENHLHGGRQTSFDRMLWDVIDAGATHVVLRHVSPDGDGGYPGELTVEAEYRVEAATLLVTYRAWTDRRTPVNMTQHAYFNLAGESGGTVDDHVLRVDADAWTPVDAALIPTGEVADVTGTPFDLRGGVRLAEGIAAVEAAGHGPGYDHNLWLADPAGALRDVAELSDPSSGRRMVLASDQPCLQVYSGNRLGRAVGRGAVVFPVHGAVCLEPQHAPDSVNRPEWPSIVIGPGERYEHRIAYRFSAA